MKKNLLAGAGVALIAGAAHAQSSVTLYGIIDEGLTYASNIATPGPHGAVSGKPALRMLGGVQQASRWGLRGSEDLGGGLAAVFTLENGFDPSSGRLGQGGLMFGKKAFVGLSGPFGTVTLGRQYDSNVDILGPLEAAALFGGYMVAHPGDLDNVNNANSTNNAIKFTSKDYGGARVAAMYGVGGIAGAATRNQVWSATVGYTRGPLAVAAGYLNARNPNVSFFGTTGSPAPTVGGVPGSNMLSPVYSGYASARTLQVAVVGGTYAIGAMTLGAMYTNTSFRQLGDLSSGPNPGGVSGNAVFNNVEASVRYQFMTSLFGGVAYDYTHGGGVNGRDGATYHQVAAGLDYFLSKRTDVYVSAVYQRASGTDSTGHVAVAAINGPGASANDRQLQARVGMRHKF